jgi:hypothetical protein
MPLMHAKCFGSRDDSLTVDLLIRKLKAPYVAQDLTPAKCRAAMIWEQRFKRIFNIDIETCIACGGAIKVFACIEDPMVFQKILIHQKGKGEYQDAIRFPEIRPKNKPSC